MKDIDGELSDNVRENILRKFPDVHLYPGDEEFGFLHCRCDICDVVEGGDKYEVIGLVP